MPDEDYEEKLIRYNILANNLHSLTTEELMEMAELGIELGFTISADEKATTR